MTRVSRVPKVNTSTLRAACDSACASFMIRRRCAPSSSRRRRSAAGSCAAAVRRFSRRSRSTSPSLRTLSRKVRRRSANGPRRARMRRWPRRRGSRAGASRDSRRSASLVALSREAALRPAPRRVPRPGRTRWLRRPAAARPRRVLPPAAGRSPRRLAVRALDRFAAEEMDVEQPVIGRAPFRRRRKRREPGLADVRPGCAARADSMAARNAVVCSGATAKPLARSSAAKETKTRTARGSAEFVAHAAASAISASSRPRDVSADLPRP